MATYVLPDLDYDFGALEPHISGHIMELHHGKHHKGYVKNANKTLEKIEEAREKEDFRASRRSRARWPSTCRVTSCTRSSGRT